MVLVRARERDEREMSLALALAQLLFQRGGAVTGHRQPISLTGPVISKLGRAFISSLGRPFLLSARSFFSRPVLLFLARYSISHSYVLNYFWHISLNLDGFTQVIDFSPLQHRFAVCFHLFFFLFFLNLDASITVVWHSRAVSFQLMDGVREWR